MADFLSDPDSFRQNFYLASPEYIPGFYWGLVLGLVALIVLAARLYNRPARSFDSNYPILGPMKFWFLMALAFMSGVAALTRPSIAKEGVVTVRGPVELFFVVGSSFSEFAQDWGPSYPSRIDLARREIMGLFSSGYIQRGDKAALFVFANGSKRLIPLADFNKHADNFIGRADTSLVVPKTLAERQYYMASSDIAIALEHLYQSLDFQEQAIAGFTGDSDRWRPSYKSNRVAIIFSDGDFDLDPEPVAGQAEDSGGISYRDRLDSAFGELKRRGFRIYSVGIGTRTGVRLTDILRRYKKDRVSTNHDDESGSSYTVTVAGDYSEQDEKDLAEKGLSRVNPDNLKMLAAETGGSPVEDFYLIDDISKSSQNFLKRSIDSHRSVSARPVTREGNLELWPWFLTASVIIFSLAWLIKQ